MSIIGNKYEIEQEAVNEGYTIPSVVKNKSEGLSFEKSVAISTLLHPGSVAAAWLVVIILGILGIHLDLFNKPIIPDKKDIEFVIVDKPAPPKNPNTKNRADINSRTGGVRDKTKPVTGVPAKAVKPAKKSASSSGLQQMVQKQQKQLIKEQSQKQAAPKKAAPPKASTPKPQQEPPRQTRPSPRPAARPSAAPSSRPVSAPKTVAPKQTTPFAIPVPAGAPKGNYLSTGPVGGTGAKTGARSGGSSAGSTGGKSYAPTPSLSTYKGTGSGSSRGSGSSAGSGGYAGNPGGGGGRPGIDAIKEPDFGPYMRELQRRIKFNWHPPKGNESRKVVLLFKIAKNGQLLSCRVYRSSGLPAADQAALNAVKLTAPFRPLPAEYKGSNIDIQFTFDYNVFGGSVR
ncbi:MAG: TonB family protein [Candidatus Gastranaerophilales bacterium]|nr:TonB family protein [Candidatus Gastranaerophilales bacterium]